LPFLYLVQKKPKTVKMATVIINPIPSGSSSFIVGVSTIKSNKETIKSNQPKNMTILLKNY